MLYIIGLDLSFDFLLSNEGEFEIFFTPSAIGGVGKGLSYAAQYLLVSNTDGIEWQTTPGSLSTSYVGETTSTQINVVSLIGFQLSSGNSSTPLPDGSYTQNYAYGISS